MPVLCQCGAGRTRRLSSLSALPARVGAGTCPDRRRGEPGPAGGNSNRSRGAPRRRRNRAACPGSGNQFATASPGRSPGVRRLAGGIGADQSAVAGQAVAGGIEPAADRRGARQRFCQRPPIQRAVPPALRAGSVASAIVAARCGRRRLFETDADVPASLRLARNVAVPGRTCHAGSRIDREGKLFADGRRGKRSRLAARRTFARQTRAVGRVGDVAHRRPAGGTGPVAVYV